MAIRRNFNERQNLQVRVRSIPACAGESAVRYDTSTKGGAKKQGRRSVGRGEPPEFVPRLSQKKDSK